MNYTDNREWDRGKTGEATWYPTDSRQNYHPREDDHYGQGKRRKFNDGVCALPLASFCFGFGLLCQGYQGYDASQGYEDQTLDASYPRQGPEHSQGQPGRGGPGGGFPKKRLQPSEPSPHVIFLGLDPDFTESDVCWSFLFRFIFTHPTFQLQSYLNSHGCSVETVTIIREKLTGSCPFVYSPFRMH